MDLTHIGWRNRVKCRQGTWTHRSQWACNNWTLFIVWNKFMINLVLSSQHKTKISKKINHSDCPSNQISQVFNLVSENCTKQTTTLKNQWTGFPNLRVWNSHHQIQLAHQKVTTLTVVWQAVLNRMDIKPNIWTLLHPMNF